MNQDAFRAHTATPGWWRLKDYPYYHWTDHNYQKFMIDIMTQLEVRYFEPQDYILKELDAVPEIYFITKGRYDIGYEINK